MYSSGNLRQGAIIEFLLLCAKKRIYFISRPILYSQDGAVRAQIFLIIFFLNEAFYICIYVGNLANMI